MSINVAAIPSPYIHSTIKRRKNTWYTIASGNWTNPNIWMSNSHRRWDYPQLVPNLQSLLITPYPTANDDVVINHSVVVDTGQNNSSVGMIGVNNLYISPSGNLTISGANRGITVVGDIQASGSLDLSGGTNASLSLNGANNYINNFISGATSTVNYQRYGDQVILDLSYRHLGIGGSGTKALANHLNIAGNLVSANVNAQSLPTTLECGNFNLTVNGTSTISELLSKTGSGSILFIGLATFTGATTFFGVNLSGNPTVEFRGGLTSNLNNTATWNTGTGSWSFTTNAQTISLTTAITLTWNAPISIAGAIAVTETGVGVMSVNQPINCTSVAGSVVGKGTIYFNSTSSLPSFTTGTFDRTSFANTVGYTMPASITLPYTNYSSLLVSNSGTKTSLGDTTLSGNLTVSNAVTASGTLESLSHNWSISGTTNLGPGTWSKTGAGNVLMAGLVTVNSVATTINFSGNPTVELRGGMFGNFNGFTLNSGTGLWSFTTNSQSISMTAGGGSSVTWAFDAPMLISGAITLTVSSPNGGNLRLGLKQAINGNNAASTLTNSGGAIEFWSATAAANSMTTGVFNHSGATTNTNSLIGYLFDGDYTIPYTSLVGLNIGGTGTKSLSGNTTLTYTLQIGSITTPTTGGTLQIGTNNLTVNGTSTVGASGQLLKSGAGSLVFVGLCSWQAATTNVYDFSGNPSIEFRGGIAFQASSGVSLSNFKTGSGTWSFTTNNQSVSSLQNIPIGSPVLISGAITLTTTGTYTFTDIVNGNNAASTWDNRGTANYQAVQRPMLTGVLQTNLAANTFIYNRAGDQNIAGGAYRTLQLAGSGNKTLLGNVTTTSYTLTPPAVLVTNGFTRA